MHEQLFSAAALPEPPRLFRVQLKPYSLGHELHLWRRNSPFLRLTFDEFDALPRGVRLTAAMQVVFVCSQTFKGNRKTMSRFG